MLPFFSVIIPTRNRLPQLAVCLEALASLDYPHNYFEVIVVDDSNERSPEDVVAQFHRRLNVSLIAQPHAGPATARNTGAARAQGQFLAFIDDDCASAPGWLQSLAAHFALLPERLIGGQTLNALRENPYSTASQSLIDYLYAYYNSDCDRARFIASNNLALPTELFLGLGGFDATFPFAAAEDREFCDRWLSHGFQITYAPEAIVYHAHPLTLRSFWRQHFNYGRGAFQFHAVRARRRRKTLQLEPRSFYWNLVTYPLAQAWHRHDRGLLFWLIGISQCANVLGFIWEAAGGRVRPQA